MLWHSQRLRTDADSARAFEHEIEFLGANVLVNVFALFGGNRQSREPSFSLPVRSRKSAFGIFIRFEGRQWRFSGLIKK